MNYELNDLAPIVLFVYNRPVHTKKTIEALSNNMLADQSHLIIYSDAAKDVRAIKDVEDVRGYIRSVSCFKSVTLVERKMNYGLADSIIDGVTNVIKKYGKVIVLEDDLYTSPKFLSYMNEALIFYHKYPRVMHISGWAYPIDTEGLEDTYFARVMNCWGWATWDYCWDHFEKDTLKILKKYDREMIELFDLNSGVFWRQIIENSKGKINTWAIYWYSSIFLNNGLCLYPTIGFVENKGFDGSGVHTPKIKKQKLIRFNTVGKLYFSNNIEESEVASNRIKIYYSDQKRNLLLRLINKLARKIFSINIVE